MASMDNLIYSFKRAGRSLVETGSKTMLKTDVVFLEREIKQRKQSFGVEVYEAMEALEVDNNLSIEQKEQQIRLAFDRARKDIAVIHAKIECKKEELAVMEAEQAAKAAAADEFQGSRSMEENNVSREEERGFLSSISGNIPPTCGNVMYSEHPSDSK